MNLLGIPREVITDHLIPFLCLNDILRLRRVCKVTKLAADDYLRLFGHQRLGEITINEHEHGNLNSLRNLLDVGFSVSKVQLKIDDPEIFGSKDVLEFMEMHGNKITDLTVNNMYCCVTSEELNFYLALTNLVSLEINTVHITVGWTRCKYPKNLTNNLKKLKINEVHIHENDDDDDPDDPLPKRVDYVSKLYQRCDKAEYLKHPLYRHLKSGTTVMNFGLFNDVSHFIYGTDEDRTLNPKIYDLSSFKYEYKYPMVVLYFARYFMPTVVERNTVGAKLLGVDTNYFTELEYRDRDGLNKLGRCLKSITNVNWIMFSIQDAPYIEEIDISSTAKCSLQGMGIVRNANRWPNLKKFSMQVDSNSLEPGRQIYDLYDQFFGTNVIHHCLTELSLLFEGMDISEGGYVCPYVDAIIASCSKVKKLKLKNWPGTNKALSKYWNGLQNLEEVCLDDCTAMGNVAFVGKDKESPTFFKLKNLKKLELMNIDKMPKITDTIFSLVFRHMKLTHLILHSAEPIKNVTSAGISSLLTGEFAETITKFPFQGWSLIDVSEAAFKKLSSEFRSSLMI